MLKPFWESLKDGFEHVTEIPDHLFLEEERRKGVLIDDLGYWRKFYGEIEVRLEPIQEDDEGNVLFLLSHYINRVPLHNELQVWGKK